MSTFRMNTYNAIRLLTDEGALALHTLIRGSLEYYNVDRPLCLLGVVLEPILNPNHTGMAGISYTIPELHTRGFIHGSGEEILLSQHVGIIALDECWDKLTIRAEAVSLTIKQLEVTNHGHRAK